MKMTFIRSVGGWALTSALIVAAPTLSLATDSDNAKPTPAHRAGAIILWSDRAKMAGYAEEKDALESFLASATTEQALRQLLIRRGYVVTSINEQSANELEFEVVKGDRSYEVSAQISPAGHLSEIEAGSNVYPALKTRKALTDSAYRVDTVIYDEATGQLYRDSQYKDQRDTDQKLLIPPKDVEMTVEQYKRGISNLGFQLTSVNSMDDDYAEFEVVKNKQTYELQIELDEASKLIRQVEVAPNFWRAEQTEQALAASQ